MPTPLTITAYAIPFRIPGNQRDRQLLHYFCVQGASDISGFVDSDFWYRTVLQSSHQEPVVRQALVALSSLHLEHATADPATAGAARQEALCQYGKSLRALQRLLDRKCSGDVAGEGDGARHASEVALICCVLFYCFESVVGNTAAALQHLRNGLGILASSRDGSPTTTTAGSRDRSAGGGGSVGQELSRVLARLDLQATMFDDRRPLTLALATPEERRVGIAEGLRKDAFSGIDEARLALDKLQSWLLHLIMENIEFKSLDHRRMPPAAVLEERERLVHQYRRWLERFNKFASSKQHGEQEGQPSNAGMSAGMQTLLVHHRITQMLLASSLAENSTVFTASPNLAAEEALDWIESILDSASARDGDGNATMPTASAPRRNFSSETGVVAPLFMLAVKCADEAVCARAARLLSELQRREGLYDAQTMAAVVEQLGRVKRRRMKQQREDSMSEQGEEDNEAAEAPLEKWAADIIDGAEGGMDAIGRTAEVRLLRASI